MKVMGTEEMAVMRDKEEMDERGERGDIRNRNMISRRRRFTLDYEEH